MEMHLDREIPHVPNNQNEDIEGGGIEEEMIDDLDSDMFRLRIAKELADFMFIANEVKNKQISRLTKKEISILSMMEMTDEILGFKLYEPFARNYRIHMISLNGASRGEVVDLVKSIGSASDTEYGGSDNGENKGFFSRIKNRLFG